MESFRMDYLKGGSVSDRPYVPIAEPSYTPIQPSPTWRPGGWAQFQWRGLGALFGACLTLAAAVVVLAVSDGQAVDSWTTQPTVYLAVAAAATNILLHYALSVSHLAPFDFAPSESAPECQVMLACGGHLVGAQHTQWRATPCQHQEERNATDCVVN